MASQHASPVSSQPVQAEEPSDDSASPKAASWRLGRLVSRIGSWLGAVRGLLASGLRRVGLDQMTGFLTSLIIHLLLLLTLAMLVHFGQPMLRRVELVAYPTHEETVEVFEMELRPVEITSDAVGGTSPLELLRQIEPTMPTVASPWPVSQTTEQAAEPQPTGTWMIPEATKLWMEVGGSGGGYEGRTEAMRAQLLGRYGGTAESERAVAGGLAWLAAHQRQSGGWRFDHREGPCNGRCEHPGRIGSSTGATALALLPFLGAGQTHRQGSYQDVVEKGLYYLQARMLETPYGGDFQEGTMYAQGLTAVALCEAYALSQDEGLKLPAQKAIDYICYAQHPGGGWRYYPGQPGDTTVTGWQLMALKSAKLAGLEVPSPVWNLTRNYFDSVQTAEGALYGYLKPDKAPTPTAVGLLSRMYLGWNRYDPRLERGVDYLDALGPSEKDMYFNYYATQVLHHYDGPQWAPWNRKLREYLIDTQEQAGHARGSWYFVDKHGTLGGRLYTTAICTMTLEVYYRYMPLYGEQAIQ